MKFAELSPLLHALAEHDTSVTYYPDRYNHQRNSYLNIYGDFSFIYRLILEVGSSIELHRFRPPEYLLICCLNVFLKSAEMNIEFVEVFKECTERSACCHLSEGVDILGEALAAIAELAIGSRNIGVGVIDVAREEDTCVHLAPVGSHLLTILTAGVEVGHLVGSEDVVHVLGELGFERSHDGKLLAHKDAGKEVLSSGEDHGLLLDVLDVSALGEELWHVVYTMAGLLAEEVAGAREDGGAYEDRYVRKG